MAPLRFSAALSNALRREAVRQAASMHPDLELAVASSTASVAARAGRSPLDAIVIDMATTDAEAVVAELTNGGDRSKLIVIAEDPTDIQRRFSLRSTQVLAGPSDAEDLAAALIASVLSLRPGRGAKAATPRPTIEGHDIVVLGCSTGGPEALSTVLRGLPARFPVPIVIVQHMPPDFTRLLADRLDKTCALTVREVVEPVNARAGEVWIAPGHQHIKLTSTAAQIELDDGPEENNCKPAVDVLFRSAAVTYGRRAVGVVLTGMGDDGARGGKLLADSGAYMIAQNEATSVVWGMPGAITRVGAVDAVVPLDDVAGEIQRQVRSTPVGSSA